LQDFSADANAAMVEYGARMAGRRDRLTARFGQLADLAREASHFCATAGEETVTRAHVRQAVRARTYRVDLPRECVERDFRDGYILLETVGVEVGQINVLTVIESDALMFGKPSRVTVATGVGSLQRAGVVNIERESDLSGPLHDKGVMILHGYLLSQFAREGSLNLQATVCFEQTYGGVDGDSASAGELCALLSSLTDVPLDQGLGVTGSINQQGSIQAVSGVNEKIEGFFRLCRSRKLTGSQGVVLPRANVPDLMLDPEVVDAVVKGQFHIYAVEHVDEMLELLTGRDRGELRALAMERLRQFRELAPR
jgi:Lon-like ATP-dependent protease